MTYRMQSGAVGRFAAFVALVVAPALLGYAADSSGAHVFARRSNGTNIVSRLVPDGTDVATAGMVSGFAQYYPDGSVKSAAEFTPNIKYGSFDDVHRTVSVLPFCSTGTATNDNSSLVGRVVIPPFVDAQGNGYISDDGTRYKVVGVSGSSAVIDDNLNLTAIFAPSTVTTVGSSYAFRGCSSLTSVSIPAATNIGDHAFLSCRSLASVDFGDTPRSSVPTLGEFAFANVPTSCKIIVPYAQYDAWIAADVWKYLEQDFVRHSEKADKHATFATGNLAEFDSDGNPTDSGIAKTSVVTKSGFPAELSKVLTGKTMPASPSQVELTVAVSNIWEALGGSFR